MLAWRRLTSLTPRFGSVCLRAVGAGAQQVSGFHSGVSASRSPAPAAGGRLAGVFPTTFTRQPCVPPVENSLRRFARASLDAREDEYIVEDEEPEEEEQGLPATLQGVVITPVPKRKGRDWIGQIHIRGNDFNALDWGAQYILHLADALGVCHGGIIPLPKRRKLYTVLRSPHVHKKARDQFEFVTHKRLICFYDTSPEVFDNFIKELGDRAPISVQGRWYNMDTRGQGRQKEGKEKLPPQNHFQPGTSPTFHMLPGAWQEVEGMGEEVDAGCIVWMDENGIAWCLDTFGVYGTAGAVSMLSDGHWVNHSGQHDDGCIQWVDVHGVRWSRDVMGVYGPSSAEYYSEDGVTWFGQGEGWLELGDEAAEYFAACGMRKVRLAEHSRKMGGAAARPRWENEKGLLHLQVPAGHGDREIGVGGLIGPGRVVSEQDRLYGGMLAEVRELEARVNSAFDAVVEELTPVVWPEMALRF